MSPGCMLLFVFGFVGGAVVINSAILVSLSVLLLVHFSISTGVPALTQNLPRILRKERPISLGIFPLPAGDGLLTPDTQKGGETPGSEQWKFQELSQPRSHTSLKDELSDVSQGGSKATTPASIATSDVAAIPPDTPLKEDNEGSVKGTDTPNKSDISKHIEVQVAQETRNASTGSAENEEKSEVQAIIESTPELDMDKDLSGYKGSSTPTKGIENKAFDRNTESLFEELSTLSQLPGDKSKAFDFLSEETEASLASRREQKREQYRQVKAHVQKEDGRVQAFGWSLPQKYKQVTNGQGENKMKNLPVPVYLRPLDEKDASMKLWCAVGVNLSGGKTRDGGSVVGASVFYKDVAGLDTEGSKQRSASQSSLDKLDQELKEQQKELKSHEELSSQVWICTSTHSATKVIIIDAIQPGNILDSFTVCNSHVLCIASVPGARETDYPAGEELSESGQVDKASLCGSMTSNSSAETDSLLGGITVVGCSTEGVTGTATSPSTNGASPVIDKPPEMEAENSEVDENVPTAEEATEATEGNAGSTEDTVDISQPGVYTEHVFTDPLGVQLPEDLSPVYQSSNDSDVYKDQVSVLPNEQDLVREEAQKMSSLLPTMWLGAQNGCLYVHSSVAQWRKCLHSIKLKDSILSIVHVKGIVLVALADGTLAIFHRGVDGQWDLSNYHLLDLGRPHHSIRCMTVVHDKVWCGYRNKIYV
uniref:Sperm associated antigen 9 n=1 Tax=Ictidomys tridecemlineatus TaxID=43179 RepID=A0A287DAT1_ICTTR